MRVLAGVVGLVVLAGYAGLRRRKKPGVVLPRGLVDALGAAGFGAGVVLLTCASADQAVTGFDGHGVGFFLSGALVTLAGAVFFCTPCCSSAAPPPALADR